MQLIYKIEFNTTNLYFKYIINSLIKEANANADGSGVDTTFSFLPRYSDTVYATTAKIIYSTSYGSANYIIAMPFSADIVYSVSDTYWKEEDADSISLYGRRNFELNTEWIQSVATAQEYAANIISKFSLPRAFPRFKFKRSSIDKQFTSPLFNLMTVNFSSKGITGEYRVGHIERSWNINEPNVIDSIYYLEPNLSVAAASTWVFPTTFPTVF